MAYFFSPPKCVGMNEEVDMMVEQHQKLERIAFAIQQQAFLLRRAGKIAQACGMEDRAAELRTLSRTRPSGEAASLDLRAA